MLDAGTDGQDGPRLGTTTELEWSRWRIDRAGPSSHSSTSAAAAAEGGADVDWLWYGDVVSLVCLRTGVRTEGVVLCRLEGKHAVYAEKDGGLEGGAGGTVGQLAKVAFRRPGPVDAAEGGGGGDGRTYLSCAPADDDVPGTDGSGVLGRPVRFVGADPAPGPTQHGRDAVDDFAIFTVGSVGAFSSPAFSLFFSPFVPADVRLTAHDVCCDRQASSA